MSNASRRVVDGLYRRNCPERAYLLPLLVEWVERVVDETGEPPSDAEIMSKELEAHAPVHN